MIACKHGTSWYGVRCLVTSQQVDTDPAAWAGAFSTAASAALPPDAEPGTHPDAAAPAIPNAVVSQEMRRA